MVMKKGNLLPIISGLLILLWIYAAGSKLAQYKVFMSQLARQPLPHWSIPILAWALPLVEIIIALFLCFQRTNKTGFIFSSLLMTAFTLYVLLALSGIFGQIPCSCGGIFSFMRWKGHLIFNICFTLISFAGWYFQKHKMVSIIVYRRRPV